MYTMFLKHWSPHLHLTRPAILVASHYEATVEMLSIIYQNLVRWKLLQITNKMKTDLDKYYTLNDKAIILPNKNDSFSKH